jgi:hypothetical protein
MSLRQKVKAADQNVIGLLEAELASTKRKLEDTINHFLNALRAKQAEADAHGYDQKFD